MKLHHTLALLGTVAAGFLGTAQATVITLDFEDRSGLGQSPSNLTNYHGVNFDNNFFTYTAYQPPYTPSSGVTRAAVNNLMESLGEVFFTFTQGSVSFLGANISGQVFAGVSFNLYYQGNLVGSSQVLAPTSTPKWLSSGYTGAVDKVGIDGYMGYYVFDDLKYDTEVRQPGPHHGVPDTGSTLALSALALGGLVALRRRK